ncbi:MAG: hypothetical protein WDO16_05195 [Bacteroidota bacterium]
MSRHKINLHYYGKFEFSQAKTVFPHYCRRSSYRHYPAMGLRSALGGFGGGSANGFRSWGLFYHYWGVIGVAIACFLGDKSKEFDDTFKKVALGSFGAIAAGALIFFLRISSYSGGFGGVSSGVGLWLCLIAGLVGLGWLLGLVKLPDNKKPPTTTQP